MSVLYCVIFKNLFCGGAEGGGGRDTDAPGGGGGRRAGTPPGLSPQAIASREELHARYAQSLQDKDALRKRVRELGGKADELQLQLFQREAQLLAAEGQLKRQQLEMLVLVRRPGPRPRQRARPGTPEPGGGASSSPGGAPGLPEPP